ncbi:hypothetical protein [Marinoscillum furvescens]|uniref:Uncharacterized protein n=1 Tax=Marinoscillum furvescens DSM 4134 TaxID=1122208 RepID=A0A3D9L2H7_MARFU|nr:hypothetical protein [Marinoscillum furvescens]RED98941.1 hypothetical protein C7460_109133 [Marinoscillum furvescens DSM 4134]
MKRFCLFLIVFASLFQIVEAQRRSFSDDQNIFFNQVMSRLRGLGTEPANKVAFDFNNAWQGKFTTAHKEQIHRIARLMDQEDFWFHPHYWYYFSYLAFAMEQADLSRDQLSEVLDMNEQMVQALSREEYTNYLLGLNMFMARRIIARSKNLFAYTDGGSFEFKLLDEYAAPAEEAQQDILQPEPIIEEPVVDQQADPVEQDDPWAQDQNDPWSNDPWANDPWGDQQDTWSTQQDSWDDDQQSYDDNWVETEDVWGYDDQGRMYEEKAERQYVETIAQDYVGGLKAKYIHPTLEGPAIQLENNSMMIITPYDSFKIKETDGTVLLKNRMYAGDNAVINWPADNSLAKGAVVNLEKFYLRTDRSDFWSPYAKMTFPKLFDGTVEGAFEYKSVRRKNNTLSSYPRFTSNYSDIAVNIPGRNIRYRGGIQIQGNAFYGTSVSRKPGTLTLLDGRGNKAVLRSVKFEFHQDSSIYAKAASVSLIHGADSLHHPSVELYYYGKTNKLALIRTKAFDVTPFYSSFFEMNINAEIVEWDMDTDSVELSILNGKDLIPVVLESKDFFSQVRFSKLGSGFAFHPVNTSVYYANKFGTREFADQEIADYFKVGIKQVKGAMKVLEKYGFAYYNRETGLVQLKDKAFLYYDASGQKVDYDNLLIPSHAPDKPNVIWDLTDEEMLVNGVDRYYFTTDFQVYAEPDSGRVTLKQGRNIEMNGMVNAGDFQYKGKDFQFDYDGFLIHMDSIDSIRIQIATPDSLVAEGAPSKSPLKNHLNRTSGTLYLDYPDNKSGIRPSANYPDFLSQSDAVVYFNGQEVLNGAYDESVKFIVPPFESDSLSSEDAVSFDGIFNSGGIFPTFEETLKLQPDQSLGFTHQIPPEGYNLYGTAAKTYEKIRLSNQGIRGGGKIDFITSTIYSDDFVYYPDSVAAYGRGGVIGPGDVNGASYPEAVLGPYRMHWEPRIDSMYLTNLRDPFKFYNATAELDGAVNITSKGVYGSGTMFTRGSRALSDNLTFKQFSYSARHAEFEVLSDNPDKPAMAGDDISLNFDLKNGTALIRPEKAGVAAISFPYAQMNTSITNAVWDLEDSVVTMTKPANVPISSSYFYTTREDLDSLAFNAEKAVYDFNTRELNVQGIPFIKVADAKIIPEGNHTTILENSELQPFNNAEIIIDTVNEYHYLYNGEIKILSRNEFVGTAMYRLITGNDTFAIKFDRFVLEEVFDEEGNSETMTISGGEVLAKDNLIIAPGFYYKGQAKMYAQREALELDGAVKLMKENAAYDSWVLYQRTGEEPTVQIDFENAYFSDESPVVAGLHYDLRGSIYTTFVEQRQNETDEDFFFPKGVLEFDTASNSYRIENPAKTLGESYQGYTMIYNDDTKNVIFEGPVNFFSQYAQDVTLEASVLGTGNMEENAYNIDALLAMDFKGSEAFMDLMAADLTDIVERLGPPLANDISSIELLYKLANFISDKIARDYEKASLKDYKPMYATSEALEKSLVVSGVKMKWSQPHKSWYNTTKLAISNIYETDVNAKLDGFIEIKKDDTGADVLNLFIQAAPGTWYYISYAANNLMMYSSNSAFNDQVGANSNYGKARPDELVLVLGDENETLSFINEFRETYFGITEPYDLVYPEDISLDDENFDTIEEDQDDGFGF